MKGKDAVNLP